MLAHVEHILEGALDALATGPQAHGPQARRVDQPAPRRQADQLRGGGGVAAPLVAISYLAGALHLPPDEGVDQRGLADAAGPQQRDRAKAVRELGELVEPRTCPAADRVDRDGQGHLLDGSHDAVQVAGQISLGQHDHRRRAAVVAQDQLALQSPLVRRRRQRVEDEHDVDVGGQRLRLPAGPFVRGTADEGASAGQYVLHPLTVRGADHPVTHRDIGAEIAEPLRRRPTATRTGRRQDRRPATIDPADAAWRQAGVATTRFEGEPRVLEERVPAQRVQVVQHRRDGTDGA